MDERDIELEKLRINLGFQRQISDALLDQLAQANVKLNELAQASPPPAPARKIETCGSSA